MISPLEVLITRSVRDSATSSATDGDKSSQSEKTYRKAFPVVSCNRCDHGEFVFRTDYFINVLSNKKATRSILYI